jgi:signal transduction histidine kinase/ligand-binding sensor domain-containing protein/AraC-like DNA-binding protein
VSKVSRLIIYGLLLCLAPVCNAQDSFRHINVAKGLSSNSINAICRDRKGYLWIGTDFGLNRFDGYRIKSYYQNPADGLSLKDNYIHSLSEDYQGFMWIMTRGGVQAFDLHHESFVGDYNDILRQRHLYINGLKYVFNDRYLSAYLYGNRMALYNSLTDRAIKVQPFRAELMGAAFDNCGYVWSVDAGGLLYKIDVRTGKVVSTASCPNCNKISKAKILADRQHNLWIVVNYNRLFYYHTSTGTWKTFDNEGFNQYPMMAAAQLQNLLCIGTDHGGLFTIDCSTFAVSEIVHQNKEDGLSDNSVISLYADDEGILYLGTFKHGIDYTHPSYSLFESYKFDSGLLDNDVNCFAEDGQGNLWLGTNVNGLYVRNRLTGKCTRVKYRPQSGGIIMSLCFDHKGRLWIGTYMDGLYCMDHGRTVHYTANDNLLDNTVWSLLETKDGHILVGTLNKGLFVFDEKSKTLRPHPDKKRINKTIENIFQDSNSDLLISTQNGFYCIDAWQKSVVHFTFNRPEDRIAEKKAINGITKDQRGYYWICTQGGLAIWDEGHHRYYFLQKKDGIGQQFVYAALVDHKNRIWVSTSMGIFCIDVLDYGNITNIKLNVTKFDRMNGLQGDIFNRRAGLASRDGIHLYFGGTNGFNIINPMALRSTSGQKNLSVTALYINNVPVNVGAAVDGHVILRKSLAETDEIHLHYDENNVRIEFSALDLLSPEKNKYEIRLEGTDSNWLEVKDDAPFVQYYNLAPGTYSLSIRAKDLSGTGKVQQRTLKIVIAPPFWKSWIAFVLYFILLGVIVYMVYRTLIARATLQLRMDKEMQEKKHVEEMYNMRVDFFTRLSHELRTPVSLIILPLQNILLKDPIWAAKNNIKMVLRNAKRLLFIVNQLLDFRKMEEGELTFNPLLGNIVSFVRDAAGEFSDMSQNKSIHYSFKSNVDEAYMDFDPQKMERILFNLLSNSFKFTPKGGTIEVSVMFDKSQALPITIRISDTGVGMSEEDLKHIFTPFYQADNQSAVLNNGTGIGLSVVHKMVSLHHGEIHAESTEGKGTVFTLSFSAAEAPLQKEVEEESMKEADSREPLAPKEKTVIIIDDNDDFRYYLVGNMKRNYNVIEAENGKVAMEKIRKFLPDIIITDVMMPVMDGIQLCKEVKDDTDLSLVPVILLTASIEEQYKIDGYKLGADAYLTKPFNVETLDVLVKNLLKKAESNASASHPLHGFKPNVEISSKDEELLKKLTEMTEKGMSDPDFSIEKMSSDIGLSSTYLNKKISAITGKTTSEYVRSLRLERACQLLVKTQLSIAEIAYEVGYSFPKYFSKHFKDEYGILPTEYRKNFK